MLNIRNIEYRKYRNIRNIEYRKYRNIEEILRNMI